jgi:hypothetical protein
MHVLLVLPGKIKLIFQRMRERSNSCRMTPTGKLLGRLQHVAVYCDDEDDVIDLRLAMTVCAGKQFWPSNKAARTNLHITGFRSGMGLR